MKSFEWAPNPMTSAFVRRRRLECRDVQREDDVKTEEGKLCDDRGKGWSYAATSQEMPKNAGSHPKLGRSQEGSSSRVLLGSLVLPTA